MLPTRHPWCKSCPWTARNFGQQVVTAHGCTSQQRRLRQRAASALQQREATALQQDRRPQTVSNDSRLIVVEGRNDMTAVLRAVDARVRPLLSATAAELKLAEIMQSSRPSHSVVFQMWHYRTVYMSA